MKQNQEEQIRIVQETVAGKEITFAHVMGSPAPSESAVIASDIAVKSGNIYLGFADRFTGTLIITGDISEVTSALTEIVNYFRDSLGYVVCNITKR